jgi:hypothetical protein
LAGVAEVADLLNYARIYHMMTLFLFYLPMVKVLVCYSAFFNCVALNELSSY